METLNNFLVKAVFRNKENYWVLDISLPMYFDGGKPIKLRPLEVLKSFESKEDAYSFAKKYLSQIGISSEILEKHVTYE